jgi:hypothetical protein
VRNSNPNLRAVLLAVICVLASLQTWAQYTFELKIEYAMRVQNTDMFSVSGVITSGKIESDKTYFLDDGTKIEVKNLISSKSATSVPVALAQENVSVSIFCKDFRPERGTTLKGIANKPVYSGSNTRAYSNMMPEGELTCKLNSRMYTSSQISKPVYIKQSDVLDIFFEAEDKSVIWIQFNDFSQIKSTPHQTKSDTSDKERMNVCKVAFLPQGYRPTDMPNNYKAFEDQKGNAGVLIKYIDRYKKKIGFEFSGILRPNAKILEEKPNAGLFYINEGRVDQIGWDEY